MFRKVLMCFFVLATLPSVSLADEPKVPTDRVAMWLSLSSIAAADGNYASDLLSFQALYLDKCGQEITDVSAIRKHKEFTTFQYALSNQKWDGLEAMKERLCK